MPTTSSFESIVQIAEGIKSITGAFESVNDFIDLVQGTSGLSEVLSAITELTDVLEAGLAEIAADISLQTQYQLWQEVSNQLNSIQAIQQIYASQLQSLDSTTFTIVRNSQGTPLKLWCEGSDAYGQTGALYILAEQLTALYEMFVTGGIGNSATLAQWDALCAAAASAQIPNYMQQTRYNLMFQFMQEIFAIVGSLFYTREAVLAVYLSQNPDNPFNYLPLPAQIAAQFGDVNTPNTVWGVFAQQLATYTANNNPWQQYCLSATTSDSIVDNNTYGYLEAGSNLTSYLLSHSYTLAQNSPTLQNAFFGSIGFGWSGDSDKIIYLVGTPVQVGPGLSYTPQAPVTAYSASAKYNFGTDLWCLGEGGSTVPTAPMSYLNTSYVTPPATSNPNQCAVVTGFSFCILFGNQFGIQLTYGILDITDPNNPTVTDSPTWQQPSNSNSFFAVDGWDQWAVGINYVDLRPAGTIDYFPITNVTFCETFPTSSNNGPGNRVGIAGQAAWNAYQAPFFQPDVAFSQEPNIATSSAT